MSVIELHDSTAYAGSCFGKTAYVTKLEARRVQGFRAKRGQSLNVYRCSCCKNWHLGR